MINVCALTEAKFLSGFEKKTDYECWRWKGRLVNGYGAFYGKNNKTIKAHRFAWTYYRGTIPNGFGYHGVCVCHKCDERSCVNPSHLFLGSQRDNMRDGVTRRRFVKPVGEASPSAKLTELQVYAIRKDRRTLTAIADSYGVGISTVFGVRHRKTWTHLPERKVLTPC